ATGRFRTRESLQPHLDSGAPRVVISTLPETPIDRVLINGVNQSTAMAADRLISAGSASTSATALALKTILESCELEHASMTSVHAYTSDQSLQDYAGPDYRRSRSGAENIIPNHTPALACVQAVLPQMQGKMTAYALNVPVQTGSLLDLSLVFSDPAVTAEDVNALFVRAEKAEGNGGLIETTQDPIVSSDVKGCRASLLVDLDATIKAGERTIKLLGWHESLGHAQRLLEVAALYCDLDPEHRMEDAQ
ncbi:MAG: glyceraldehyde-3-phosphate dehydrogenase, partial [Proteobacteria bacterium]|nr:glyceraldehyde-3-phosphate dehydrogenase [Pseudomonadota bacterium]